MKQRNTFLYTILNAIPILFFCSHFIILVSCTEKSLKKAENAVVNEQYISEKNEVSMLVLEKGVFKDQLISNGKLIAVQKNDVKFKVSGDLEKLMVKEGDYVSKNRVMAELTRYKYREELSSAEISLKKSLLELEDILVGRGYDLKEKEKIPEEIYEMAGLRSGYTEALQKVKNAKYNLNATSLRAPFNGKIATIKNKLYEQVSEGNILLTLIDDTYFEVAFYITESEIYRVKKGEEVNIFAIGLQKEYKGTVVTINPLVEQNGTILVKARVKNDGSLLEGMNVKIRIEKSIPDQFVIPKSAIVLRQNEEVLFKVVDGKAFWTYVKTVNENNNYYTVIPNPEKPSSTLKIGDTIITDGNLNLAHNSPITIKN